MLLSKPNKSLHDIAMCIRRQYALVSDKMSVFPSRVALDVSFNRSACWDPKLQTRYVTSMIKGMAPSPIVVANIADCLETIAHEEDSLDYIYFKRWMDAGYEFIAVDGNNRTITISNYLKGKVPIAHGEYTLPTGTIHIGPQNDNYLTHPQALKEHIANHIMVDVIEYTVSSRASLSTLFININDGDGLNSQELRNAVLVPFADHVRNLSARYADAFKNICSKGNYRLAIDEQIVILATYYAYDESHGVSKKDKDNAYSDNSTVWNKFYNGGGKSLIEATLRMVESYGTKAFKDSSTLLNLFIVMREITKQNRKILDKSALFKWFMASEAARMGDLTLISPFKNGAEQRTYAGCNRATSDHLINARYQMIKKDLNTIPTDIVTSLDTERLFTKTMRYHLWKKQDGICPETGKEIPEDEVNNHDLWSADHIVPWSKGGPTTLDNGRLICKKANEKKGAKMPELMAA